MESGRDQGIIGRAEVIFGGSFKAKTEPLCSKYLSIHHKSPLAAPSFILLEVLGGGGVSIHARNARRFEKTVLRRLERNFHCVLWLPSLIKLNFAEAIKFRSIP